MENKLEDKYKKYYKYKAKYEKKYKDEVQNIKDDKTLTDKTKREKVKQLRESKMKCINCKKLGGNIFGNTSGIMTISCGNQDNPCNVGDLYNVETSYVENLRNVHNSQLEDMKELKHTMIHTKLDYLFGFTNEETTLSEFEILKTKMKNISKELKNTKDLYENVVVNKEKQDDIRNMDKVTKELIQKIKSTVLEYSNTKDDSLFTTIIEIYRDELLKHNDTNRNTKYDVFDVNVDEHTHTAELIQKPFEYDSLYIAGNRADMKPKWNEMNEMEQNNLLTELLR